MAMIKIDGVEYEVEAGKNLLQSCLELGLDLPYFCWHPAMGSVGACRQCAVVQFQNEEDDRGRIVMGCMTPVSDGAIFSLSGDKAASFREAIVESLMLNHPHDCPVCAEGGECHLQDMTVMVGHRDRNYRGSKNTHRNQYLGPLVHHEMNRCITCYRCTRYYRDYAGGEDLAAMAAHDHVYFGRHEEGNLTSPFAGNLVEVCPTGVFTDKSLVNEYTRKWDLQSAPSICTGCALGCNTLPGERYGRLKRIHNRFNPEVNGYFLCDRGRFGGAHVNNEQRLDFAGLQADDGCFTAIDAGQAIALAADHCREKRLAAIGSPRASVESNFCLQKLVGRDNFCSGMDDVEHSLVQRALALLATSSAHNPSLSEIESADAVLILGEDPTQTAPRMALSLRQSVRNRAYELAAELRLETWQDAAIRNLAQEQRSPLHIVCAASSDLDDIAASSTALASDDQVLLADAILAELEGQSTGNTLARDIAADLSQAKKPLIIGGTAEHNGALLDRAASIAAALASDRKQADVANKPLPAAMFSICLPESNSMGTALLTQAGSCSFSHLAERAARGEIDTLFILENDVHRRAPIEVLQTLKENIACIIGIDYLESLTLTECTLALPATGFSESEGTLVNNEGRAQRSFPAHPPAAQRRQSWQWIDAIAKAAGRETAGEHFDDVVSAVSADNPLFAHYGAAAPDHAWRSAGLKVPRQTHRASGRTAMRANISVHEPKQTADEETPLAYTMEGASKTNRPGALVSYMWSPGWNSNQSLHKFQHEVGGSLRGGTAAICLLDSLQLSPPAPLSSPDAFQPHVEDFQLHARHRVFGSEELSAQCERVGEIAGDAFVELHPDDAARLQVIEGDGVQLCQISLAVKINPAMARGCAGYSVGFKGCEQLRPGQWAPLSKDPDWHRHHPQVIGSDGGGHV